MSNHELLQTHDERNYSDLVSISTERNRERLQNITIEDTHGEKALARGWGSILMHDKTTYIKAPELVDSSQTPYRALILLAPPGQIGTHEDTDPHNVPAEGEDKGAFEGIDYTNGWNGSPIAAACFAVCEGDRIVKSDIYSSIYKALSSNDGIGILESLREYGDIGILDGHHRAKYAIDGPIKLKYVPLQIIPYLYDSSVVLRTWHADGNYLLAEDVFKYFKDPDKYVIPKKTKFGVIGKDGVTRRILDTQPNVRIPLQNLI